MSTPEPTTPDPSPGLAGTVQTLVKAIQRTPKNAQAGLLTGVLLMIVALAGLRNIDRIEPGQIVLLGMLCAAILLATLKKDAIWSVMLLLVFVILGVVTNHLQPTPLQATPVPADSLTNLRRIHGTVLERSTRTAIADVVVRAADRTEYVAVSDSFGEFKLLIPHAHTQGDSVHLRLRSGGLDTTFWQRIEENRARVVVRAIPSNLTVGPGLRTEPLARFASWTSPGPRSSVPSSHDAPLVVIVDSIRTLRAGSNDPIQWMFHIEVNDREVMQIARRPYSDHGAPQLLYVGTQAPAEVSGTDVVLRVEGTRKRLIGSYRIHGTGLIKETQLPDDTPVRIAIDVRAGAGEQASRKGHFRFYLTVLRSPAP